MWYPHSRAPFNFFQLANHIRLVFNMLNLYNITSLRYELTMLITSTKVFSSMCLQMLTFEFD